MRRSYETARLASTPPVYRGWHSPTTGDAVVLRPDGTYLDPTGLSWGHLGSGCAQLSIALLLDRTGDAALTEQMYQRFKEDVVAVLPGGGDWLLAVHELDGWIAANRVSDERDRGDS